MYKLTENRREAAEPILEKYRKQMESGNRIDCNGFERELRECWNIGYQSLKDIVVALSKEDEYERMAAYYMQHQNALGPVSEFKPRLAELYGMANYDSKDDAGMRSAYWARS